MNPRRWSITGIAVALCCGLVLSGCGGGKKDPSTENPTAENQLSIDNFSLEQSNAQGKLWWKMKAKKASYTIDRKVAQVKDLAGELYQDGQVIMKLTAQTADVIQDGEKVTLRGDVTTTETRNQLVVVSQELEWQPNQDLLTISKGVRATHPKAQMTGDRGNYMSRQQRLELFDKIIAVAPAENIRLQTSYLLWNVDTANISGDKPVRIDRFKDGKQTEQVNADSISYNIDKQVAKLGGASKVKFNSIAYGVSGAIEQTMKVEANSATWEIQPNIVALQDKIRFDGTKPVLRVTSNTARWYIKQQLITASNALEIFDPAEQATFIANSGSLDLAKNTAVLNGNARGSSTRNQAKIQAEKITWDITTQQITGKGQIRYQQTDPVLKVNGAEALGKLQDQSVVITGNGKDFVETQIIPSPESPTK
jgi:LPS export ABC transporter protein LptC